MMPLFMAHFGSTLDELGEPVEQGGEVSIKESVEEFCIYFAVIGAVAGIAGFVMVTLWSIAGERQVRRRFGFCLRWSPAIRRHRRLLIVNWFVVGGDGGGGGGFIGMVVVRYSCRC